MLARKWMLRENSIQSTGKRLLFSDFESFFEGFVVEDQFDLFIAFGFRCFAFAVSTAEFYFCTSNSYRLSRIDWFTGEGAVDLLGLLGGNQLQVGFGSKLFGVGCESSFAFATAEADGSAFVVDSLCRVGRFAGNGANCFAFFSSKALTNKCSDCN